jgi:hypothetical protein
MRTKVYLMVRADHTARIVNRQPRSIRYDEVAIPLWLNFADEWGKVLSNPIEIAIPAPPAAEPVTD